jgi:hypothetical protein
LHGGKLLQQYVVDNWASPEQRKLAWIKGNQGNLRADLYDSVVDAFADGDHQLDPNDLGQKFILPATFQGSYRDMLQNLQNSLAIAREKGSADAFLTMTCNPKCPEIQKALLEGQTAAD